MIAAVYARTSTAQDGVADDAKSVTRQIAHATAYATRKGWAVLDAHVYVDDGISGAEFANRPGFVRLMAALRPRPPFQVLIMSEESRLGREAIETAYALKQLITAGVRVFFYLEDRERTFDSPTDKLLMSVTAFADELEREKARQRTYDAMQRKARAGHVTGGRVFGYDNLEVLGQDGRRSHVERCINEPEAAIVRRIFELCAEGAGLTRITKMLNAERVPAPRPQQGRPRAWAGSTVRDVLQRELYRGIFVWNQTRKRDRWGQHRQHARPEGEWLRVPVPALRIVSDTLWTEARTRFDERRRMHTTPGTYRRRRDVDSEYLLSGVGRCGVCGGSFAVHTRQHGGARVPFYGCAGFWKKGATVCTNNLMARRDGLEEEFLATLQDDVMRPTVVEEAIRLALAELAPTRQHDNRQRLERELAKVRTECERLADAIARGGSLDVLLDRLRVRQARCVELEGQLTAERAFASCTSVQGLERRLCEKLADWRGLLMRNVNEGRAVLRTLLMGPIRFTPIVEERRRGYAFEGLIALDRLLAGVLELPPLVASPAGCDVTACDGLPVDGYAHARAA